MEKVELLVKLADIYDKLVELEPLSSNKTGFSKFLNCVARQLAEEVSDAFNFSREDPWDMF